MARNSLKEGNSMPGSIKQLYGNKLAASDGEIGQVKDFISCPASIAGRTLGVKGKQRRNLSSVVASCAASPFRSMSTITDRLTVIESIVDAFVGQPRSTVQHVPCLSQYPFVAQLPRWRDASAQTWKGQ